MKIYLIRHGQTTSDVEDRYGGDYDDHLTEFGEKQVNELAQKLENSGIEVLFASNRIRAQETAKILQKKLKVEIKTEKGLRERNLYGKLTGMVKSEAKEKYPELVERIKNTQDTIEGAEYWKDFVDRVVDSFNKISKMDYKTVGMVSHGGPIRRILWEVLGVKKEQSEIKIDDCAFCVIETNPKGSKLVSTSGIKFID